MVVAIIPHDHLIIAEINRVSTKASYILAISKLRRPIDNFFEFVQVNSDNDIVKRNRLNLLGQIRTTCSLVADLSKIEGQSS